MADAKYVEKPTERPTSIKKLDNSALETLSKKLSPSARIDRSLLLERGILKDHPRISSSLVQAQMSLMRRKTGDELNNFLSKRKTIDELVKNNVLKDPQTHGRIAAGVGELKKKQTEDLLSKMYANRPTLSDLVRKSIVIDIGESMDANSPNSPKYLGRAERMETLYSPVQVEMPDGFKAVRVGCGYSFSVALGENGKLVSWGKGENGKTGQGTLKSSPFPNPIDLNDNIVDLACADGHTLCISKSGKTYSWGWGWNYRLGHNTNEDQLAPKEIEALSGVNTSAISAGAYQSCFVSSDKKLYTCGWGKNGRLGHGNEADKAVPLPVPLSQDVKVTSVKSGSNHILFSTDAGEMWGFGRNDYGQLGLGNRTNAFSPVKITGIEKGVKAFGCGWSSSAVITAKNELLTFGKGEAGQLGSGKLENSDKPIKVAFAAGDVPAEAHFTSNALVVLTQAGKVLTCGRGHLGELGLGQDKTFSLQLTAVPELSNVTVLDSGVSHCICLTSDGSCYVWGEGKSCFTGEDAVRSSSMQMTATADLDEIAEGEEEED